VQILSLFMDSIVAIQLHFNLLNRSSIATLGIEVSALKAVTLICLGKLQLFVSLVGGN
jgi:hypothetical protein